MLLDLKKIKNKYNIKINGVIHIGAHFGQEIVTYEELGIKNIMFFEPIPETFNKLKENVGDKAKLIQSALGNVIGEIEMNVENANMGQSNSILEPKIHLLQYPHIRFTNKIKVPITKLDSFIEEKNNYNFINIDVQGYELEVFKGAVKFLENIDYIMTEVNRDEVYKDCAKIDEIDSFLGNFNFERFDTTWDGGTWGDAFYIKNYKIN